MDVVRFIGKRGLTPLTTTSIEQVNTYRQTSNISRTLLGMKLFITQTLLEHRLSALL